MTRSKKLPNASPTLNLRIDCLEAPTRYDVAVVSTYMLWPRDEEQRTKALDAIASELTWEDGFLPSTSPSALEHRRIFLADVRRVGRLLEDLKTRMKRPIDCGIVAGMHLFEVSSHYEMGRRISLKSVKIFLADWYKRWPNKHLSEPTIQDFWEEWRLVAPLWAAYLWMGEDNAGELPFPIEPEKLGELLAAAMEFRAFGVWYEPKSARGPMLRDDETFNVDPRLTLPPSPLRFQKMPVAARAAF